MHLIVCKVCNGEFEEQKFIVAEKMFGLGGSFIYKRCSVCATIQLSNIPDSLDSYYPSNYYSLKEFTIGDRKILSWLKFKRDSFELGELSIIGWILASMMPNLTFRYFKKMRGLHKNSEVLDVGCGNGELLYNLKSHGFQNLTGLDPYLPTSLVNNRQDGLRLIPKELRNISGSYQLVVFNHVFEHLSDPRMILKEVKKCMPVGGYLLVRVPLCDSYAFKRYSTDWAQIDAPRHMFLYTRSSLIELYSKYGFRCIRQDDDSTDFQFWGSLLYKNNHQLSLFLSRKVEVERFFGKWKLLYFKILSRLLNFMRKGDQGIFLFQHVA